MTFAQVLILLSAGIALSQIACHPSSVTLRWLRLGDLIAISLLAVAMAVTYRADPATEVTPAIAFSVRSTAGFLLVSLIVHLVFVQLGKRQVQRIWLCTAILLLALPTLFPLTLPPASSESARYLTGLCMTADPAAQSWIARPASFVSAFLLGGALMTMLLGHAYLTAGGEMTQAPFLRLTAVLFAAIILRCILAAGAGIQGFQQVNDPGASSSTVKVWLTLLLTVRFLVGLVVPAVMVYGAWACVRIRSNQSATGILYVAGILLLIGELTAFSLQADFPRLAF